MKRSLAFLLIPIAIVSSSCSSGAPGPDPFPAISGDFVALVAELDLSPEASGGYVPPTDAERASYRSALVSLLEGDTDSASEALEDLGLEIVQFSDEGGSDFLLFRENRSPLRGWGLFALNTSGTRALLLEAPHPRADLHTETQAADLFLKISARGLLIAGAHRCANASFSPCSGATSVCSATSSDEPYRTSDAAHDAGSLFQVAHEVLLDADATLTAVALHGFGEEEGDPHAFVSNGTKSPFNDAAVSNRFAAALREASGLEYAARSCNDGSAGTRLCGTEDVQGRFANGSADVCLESTGGASGRFLHLEQSLDLRTEGGEVDPRHVRTALEATF